jgi:prepilin-type N-terminal cleavage/methylation domain-containing protein
MWKHRSSGFTLIELIVVLAIAALGIALVTPNMIRAYDNFKVAAEERKLIEVLASIRMKAFFRNTAYMVKLESNTLLLENKGVVVRFEHVTFPLQRFKVNEHGFSEQPRLWYQLSNRSEIQTIENNSGAM